jgi:DNA repair exonuclease SbcCD ATPase subunit
MVADDKTRKDILEAILQLADFDEVLNRTKKRKFDLENDKIRVEGEIDHYSDKILDRENKLKIVTSAFNDVKSKAESDLEEATSKIKELEQKKLDYSSQISLIKGALANVKNQYTNIKNTIDEECSREIEDINNSFKEVFTQNSSKYTNSLTLLETNFNEVQGAIDKELKKLKDLLEDQEDACSESTSAVAVKRNEIQVITSKLKGLKELNSGTTCPTCYSEISADHTNIVEQVFTENLEALKGTLTNILEEQKNHSNDLVKIKDTISKFSDKKTEAIKKYNSDKMHLMDNYRISNSDIENKKNSTVNKKRDEFKIKLDTALEAYNKLIAEHKVKIGVMEAEYKIIDDNIEIFNKVISSIEENLKNYEDQISYIQEELVASRKKLNYFKELNKSESSELSKLSFWVEAFSQKGIRSFIFETALPQLMERANYYSSVLTGGTILIEILPTTMVKSTGNEKEKLNIIVTNSLGASEYSGCSEGEKRRVDLCILLALQDLIASRGSRKWSTVIYDELFDTLDNTGISSVIDLFKSMCDSKSVYIISHNSDLKAYFDSAIVIKKEQGVSNVYS